MTIGPLGGPDRRVGGSQMPPGFDVMVSSMDALNASVRQLSQDVRRAYDAQSRFTPGEEGEAARRARDNMPEEGGQGPYNPAAGQTTTGSLRGALGRAAQRLLGPGQQSQNQNQPVPPRQQNGQPPPLFQPFYGPNGPQDLYGPYGAYGPFGGGYGPYGGGYSGGGFPMGPMGPMGPGGGGHGGSGGGGGHGGGPYGHGMMWPGGGGGGWTNMLMGAARHVPYVGTAIRAGTAAIDIYQSEREKNRFYQSIEGGSNAAGFGERFHEEAYRWSKAAVLPDGMARRAFKGVTALGYTGKSQTGQGRQDALNFVSQNYKNRGMDVNESLDFLQTASRDATVNFNELSDALKEVSDTAGKAGVNAKLMRQSFEQMLQSSISTGAGPGAAQLAGIFSSTQASYGREFQGVDFSGQLSTQYQYMVGAQYGVNPGQLQGIMRNQPGEYARMVAGSQMNWIQTVFSQQQIQDLKGLIGKYGTSEQAVPQIEQEFLNNHPEIDLNVIAQTLSGALTGVQLDNSNVMDWVIQQLSGNTAAAHGTQNNAGKPVGAKNTQGARTGKFGLYKPSKNDTPHEGMEGVKEGLQTVQAGKEWWGGSATNKAGSAYVKQMEKSGQRDPVLEALLQNVKDPNKTKVRVSTASGDRVVSFEEAMKLFPNELASGKVQIVTGDQAGKSTSDIVGGNADPNRDTRNELTNKQGQQAGQSLTDYEKKHGKIKSSNPAVSQRVTVDLTSEAKRLLQLLPSTNNQANATGFPPYNPNPAQGSRGGN